MTNQADKIKHPRYAKILLGLILALAFGLRMSQPTLTEFKLDEAGVVRRAQAIAYEGDRPASGAGASVGTAHLPLNLYLMALPLRLWNDPVAAILFTTLLNSLAVFACYIFGATYFGADVGLIAALLFAVNPWAVLYARKIWSQNLPLVTLGFFGALAAALIQGRRRMLSAAFAALAALIGLHLGGIIFIPVLGLAILLYRDQVSIRALVLGAGIFALALAPYVLHDAQHDWQNLRGLRGYAGEGGAFSWDAVRYPFQLSGSAGIEGQVGAYHEQFRAALPNLWWGNTVIAALVIGGAMLAAGRALRGATSSERRSATLLLLWFGLPILFQLRPSAVTQPHYFLLLYPVQFLLIAMLLVAGRDWLSRRFPKNSAPTLLWRGVLLILTLWSFWQIAITAQLRHSMITHPTTGGHGIPLRYPRAAVQTVRHAYPGAEVIVLTAAPPHPFLAETPTVFDALLFGHPHRFAAGQATLPIPEASDVVYLLGPQTAPATFTPLQRLRQTAPVTSGPDLPLADGGRYRVYHFAGDRDVVLAEMSPLAGGIPFANHVVFAAYDAPRAAAPGDGVTLWLAWWLQGPPPAGQRYHLTAQLLDEAGQLYAQDDHAGFPTQYWQINDIVLSRFVIHIPPDAPPGGYHWRMGMYRYPEVTSVAVIDSSGQPIDDGVTLQKLTITP
ncbi:MAG: hypothetical protein ACLFTI_05985 [Anaerolineales bacterium]